MGELLLLVSCRQIICLSNVYNKDIYRMEAALKIIKNVRAKYYRWRWQLPPSV